MSRIPSISSNHRLEPAFHMPRTSTSVKGTSRFDKKHLSPVTPQPKSRFFITQDEALGDFQDGLHDENYNETKRSQDFNMVKGYHFITDKRVKGILGKLDATVSKLNNAWDSCEKTMAKSSSMAALRPKLSATFALTEAQTTFGTNQSNTTKTSGGVNHLLSMTMSDFLNPNVTMKMRQVGQSVDMDPRTNEIKDHLWDHINKGRDYFNTLKEEIRKRTEKLKYLTERMEVLDIMADNTSLEDRIAALNVEIGKAERDIEMAEMETDVLHSMIYQRKEDRDLNRKRFTLQFGPYLKLEKELDKNVENIMEIERAFGGYMVEMEGLKKNTKDNNKLIKKIKTKRNERENKDQQFEDNVEMERIYMKKQKAFIIKTKKEIEMEQQRKKEREEYLEAQKINGLMTLKKGYEKEFDLLSTVSKKYELKEDYLNHLDHLRDNNQDLERKVMELSEEISLKRKIDLPTLQAELNELKTSKDPSGGFNEVSHLRKEWLEKVKRNEMIEAKLSKTQMMNTNLMRGVMTIFHNVSAVKDYLNLSKLEEVKLKLDNLGDVLLFCGEVLEILAKNRQEPEAVRSQPLSFASLSDEE